MAAMHGTVEKRWKRDWELDGYHQPTTTVTWRAGLRELPREMERAFDSDLYRARALTKKHPENVKFDVLERHFQQVDEG